MTVRYDHQRPDGTLDGGVVGDDLLIASIASSFGSASVGYQTPTSMGGPCGSLMLKCWKPTVASARPAVTAMNMAKTCAMMWRMESPAGWNAKDPANGGVLR